MWSPGAGSTGSCATPTSARPPLSTICSTTPGICRSESHELPGCAVTRQISRRLPGGDTGPARPAGVAAGALCAWRKAPFLAVVLVAAATTALLRLLSVP